MYFTAQIRNQKINNRSVPSSSNNTQNQRSLPASNSLTSSHERSENATAHQYHQIFQILCDYIEDWRDFGRCLDITEGDLKRIAFDQSLHNNTKLMTNCVLEQAQWKFGNRFIEKLCEALVETRRKDILRKLKELNLLNC